MPSTNRRSFLGTVSLLGIGAVATRASGPLYAQARAGSAPWDLAWLDDFNGQHRQVFDLDGRNPVTNGNPLVVVRNWLNAHLDVYSLSGASLNTCVGITSECFPMNASDALWTQYPIGEHWQIKDPDTGAWAKRNIWLDRKAPSSNADISVRGLQARGTIFWQCNNALNGVVYELAKITSGQTEKVRADLVAGLNPGVRLVPAHTMLIGLVQERKFSYQKL
jgi:hypothetical protein